jgi:hypothetical protein
MSSRAIPLLIAAAALSGCVTATTPAAFSVTDSAYVLTEGPDRIEGRAIVTQGGTVATAAGNPVVLIPATRYHAERMQTLYGSAKQKVVGTGPNPEPPPEFLRYRRMTTADAEGRFRFDRVAPGSYYIITQVNVPGGKPIALYDQVTVAGGTASVTLTGV